MNDIDDLTELSSVKEIRRNQVDYNCHAVMLATSTTREVRVAWLEHLRDDYRWLADSDSKATNTHFVLFEKKVVSDE